MSSGGAGLSRVQAAAAVVPSVRQYEWQKTEFYAFVHFGMNTMTNKEWGHGHEDPALFDPSNVDVDLWVRAFSDAGMRGVILTCKHHDGFGLWPSALSSHTVASSPWRGGQGDLAAEVSAACADQGLKFGIYLSPWDRTEPSYGSGEAYDDFFVAQLTELLTGYGEVFSVWFDGANGEGADGRRQTYDWDRYYDVVRRLQPNAVISVCGPDVRWCGNEAGETRENEWSVVPASLRNAERTASYSQQVDDGQFSTVVRTDDADLGGRAALVASTDELVWYPAEVNTSIRPGWFHHPEEDSLVRTPDELFEIYRRSVGGNSTFLLNVPPNRHGLLAPSDIETLSRLGERIRGLAERNVAGDASVTFSSAPSVPTVILDTTPDSGFWMPADADALPTVTLRWDHPQTVCTVSIREQITEGQRVECLEVRGRLRETDDLRLLATVESVGYQRIIDLTPVEVRELVVSIPAQRAPAAIAAIAVAVAVAPVAPDWGSTSNRRPLV